MAENHDEFIEFILGCGALKIGDFTLKSGRKSPYFFNSGHFDTGRTISKLARFYAEKLNSSFKLTSEDIIFGPAYKGIPLAVGCAIQLNHLFDIDVGYAFDRKRAKEHGEGTSAAIKWCGKTPTAKNRLFMIDDVISTAQTKIDALNLIKALYGELPVCALVIAIDREEITQCESSAKEVFEQLSGVPVISLTKISEVFHYLKSNQLLTPKEIENFLNYFREYGTEGLKERVGLL